MALTREDGVRAGMLLLSPGNWEQIRWEDDDSGVREFLNSYQDDERDAFSNGFSWAACASLLSENGIKVTDDEFEEYSDEEEHSDFFDAMFQTMLRPPISKPLEDWL